MVIVGWIKLLLVHPTKRRWWQLELLLWLYSDHRSHLLEWEPLTKIFWCTICTNLAVPNCYWIRPSLFERSTTRFFGRPWRPSWRKCSTFWCRTKPFCWEKSIDTHFSRIEPLWLLWASTKTSWRRNNGKEQMCTLSFQADTPIGYGAQLADSKQWIAANSEFYFRFTRIYGFHRIQYCRSRETNGSMAACLLHIHASRRSDPLDDGWHGRPMNPKISNQIHIRRRKFHE